MLQEVVGQTMKRVGTLEIGLALGLAFVIVDKIVAMVVKLKGGNGKAKKCIEDARLCQAMKNTEDNNRILANVKDVHDKQIALLDGQTLVLDRIYQGQALQIKALEKLNDKMDR